MVEYTQTLSSILSPYTVLPLPLHFPSPKVSSRSSEIPTSNAWMEGAKLRRTLLWTLLYASSGLWRTFPPSAGASASFPAGSSSRGAQRRGDLISALKSSVALNRTEKSVSRLLCERISEIAASPWIRRVERLLAMTRYGALRSSDLPAQYRLPITSRPGRPYLPVPYRSPMTDDRSPTCLVNQDPRRKTG